MQPGQRIGKYVLGERIAIGGMAEVWAARVEGPRGFVKPLALKFMLESFAGDPELERLFVNEARVAAQLQHANIVSIFDFDKVSPADGGGLQGRYYIAMERVEGRDLRQLALGALGVGQPFPRSLALHVAGEVLKGLRYVHERREGRRPLGLIHRDVSPHNVLVSFNGEVKLSDFGIAKARAHTTSGAATGNIRGKLAYASPEQLDDLPVDHRTDQFALGVTMWELLAGRRLFEGTDELDVMTKVSRCQIPPFSSLPATRDIAPAIESVVRRMLQRRIEDRYPTPAEARSAVVGLPGYSADGAPLGNLVRRLFLTQTDFPVTGPLITPSGLRAPLPVEVLPATQTMPPARKTPAPVPSGTRSVRSGPAPGRGTQARKSSRTSTSSQPMPRASRGSDGSPGHTQSRAGTASRRRVWLIAVGVALLVGGAVVWIARARSRSAAVDEQSADPGAEQGPDTDPAARPRREARPVIGRPEMAGGGRPATEGARNEPSAATPAVSASAGQEAAVAAAASGRIDVGPFGLGLLPTRQTSIVAPFATNGPDGAAASTDTSAPALTPGGTRGGTPRGPAANAAPIVE